MLQTEPGAPPVPHPLRSQPYRLLLVGQAMTGFGDAMAPVALAFAVIGLGGSTSDLGLVVAAYAAAQVVAVLFGGVIGDRLPRRLVMSASALAVGITQTVTAASLIMSWGNLSLLTGAALVSGALAALGTPSSRATTRQTVPDAALPLAVSILRLSRSGAMVAGYGLAGILVASSGAGWAIALSALCFLVAAGVYTMIRVAPATSSADQTLTGGTLIGDLRVGVVEVFRHPWLAALLLQAMLYHLFYGGTQNVLGPVLVSRDLGEAAWGWALSALMVGYLVGGVTTFWFRPRHGLFVGTVLLLMTVCFPLAIVLSSGVPLILAGAFLHGFGLEIFSVNWDLSIQQNIAEDKLARIYAFDYVGSFVARPVGLALTGPVAEAVGYDRWISIVIAVMLLSVLMALTVPSVRRITRA
ncbi:MFS transporter [Micromonospora chokoriensis]